MKTRITGGILILIATMLSSPGAHAVPISLSFEFQDFVSPSGLPAPQDPVSGTIVYDAPDLESFVEALISIDLVINGVSYQLEDVEFVTFDPTHNVIGGPSWAGQTH